MIILHVLFIFHNHKQIQQKFKTTKVRTQLELLKNSNNLPPRLEMFIKLKGAPNGASFAMQAQILFAIIFVEGVTTKAVAPSFLL